MFDGIAEHKACKTEVSNAIVYEIAYLFYCYF